LDEIGKLLTQTASQPLDPKKPALGPSFDLDVTNRHPFGKIFVSVEAIHDFPYYHNLFVRLSCNPYVLQTKRILDSTSSSISQFTTTSTL
jgi:hypothetical protein